MPQIRRVAHTNTTVGLPGTLAARLQPNHPTDDIDAIIAETYEGLSYGVGDAVLGINPVIDDPENVGKLLNTLYDIIVKWDIPTQHSVLAHVTTQVKCIRQGIPVGVVFQSLAGSQKGNEAFGISVEILDEAYDLIKKHSTCRGPNYFYFETGQGAELSSDAHHGADQVTMGSSLLWFGKSINRSAQYCCWLYRTWYLYNSKQVIRAGWKTTSWASWGFPWELMYATPTT